MASDLWGSLLRESSKRFRYPESVCIFVGDSECGKTKLIEKLCSTKATGKNVVSSSSSDVVSKEIMSYNYFEIDETLSNSETPSKVGIWSVGDKCFEGSLETIVRSSNSKTERVLFLIGVDLSRPEDECVKSLEQWLSQVFRFSQSHHTVTGAGSAAKQSLIHYLQTVKHSKTLVPPSSAEGLPTNATIDESFLKVNVGFPIIVVGCKADVIGSQNEAEVGTNAKELQGRLRALCLQCGAALIYTSADKATNIATLRKYMYHRLYPEVVPNDLMIEDTAEATVVPAGFDRAELVEISTGIKNVATSFKTTADWEKLATAASHMSASSVVLSAAPDVSPGVPGVGAAEIESEDEWLTGLQNYIKQVCDLTPSLAPTAAVSSGSIASTASESSMGAPKSQRNSGVSESAAEAAVSGTAAATAGSAAAPPAAAPVSIATSRPKRGAAANASATSGQDVNSFFQNLLAKK